MVNTPKDPNTAFLIELLGGLVGFLGLGYIYVGRTNDGLIRLVIYLVYNVIAWIAIAALSVVIVGCFCIPLQLIIQLAVAIFSANQLKTSMQGGGYPATSTFAPGMPSTPSQDAPQMPQPSNPPQQPAPSVPQPDITPPLASPASQDVPPVASLPTQELPKFAPLPLTDLPLTAPLPREDPTPPAPQPDPDKPADPMA
jgi:hypothetical protein